MKFLPEVLKILDGALRSDPRQAYEYAGLLAELLEKAGERQQATRIRERLARTPRQTVDPAARMLPGAQLPTDRDSGQRTLDELHPAPGSVTVELPDAIERRLREFLESIRHHEKLANAGVAQAARLLLYGPPGCGKTLTATLIAAELDVPLLTVRCDSLVSSLLGQTGKNLRRVFEHAEQRPCVLFLDEFDALAKRRSDEREVGELQRVVIALLQNIDALPESTVLVAATNHPELLDPAVWRRFSFRIQLPLPDGTLRERFWRRHLQAYAPDTLDWSRLVTLSAGLSAAAVEQVARDALRATILEGGSEVDELDLLRRLGLTQAMQRQELLASVADEVRWLRQWQPNVFSLRNLAKLHGLSVRQVTNLTKGSAECQATTP